LSTELAAHDAAGYTPYILGVSAQNVSAATLSKLRSAFGPTLVNAAVSAYAPAAVQSAYNATPAAAALTYSQYYVSLGNAAVPELSSADGNFGEDVMLLAFVTQGFGNEAQAAPLAVRYLQTHVPQVVSIHQIALCNNVSSCLSLFLLAAKGTQLAWSNLVLPWELQVSGPLTAQAYWSMMNSGNWTQRAGYIQPSNGTATVDDVDPPVEGPPTPEPPEFQGPPTPPTPEQEGPPSPQPIDGGSAQIGGDSYAIVQSD
jgi:hypothetical protein